MFSFIESKTSASKAYVSNGNLPQYVDPDQPPSAKKPFSTILNQPFNHTVQLTLPEELYRLIGSDVEAKFRSLQYSRVIMPLSALLEGDFFNSYIKTGNILMLSEGRPGVDDKYCLKDGQLRLDLAKENYERSGLGGKPIRDGGRKHMKTRYAVEIDLRQPSMLHGKKGFERIVWAFKNVFSHSVTWLFHNFEELSSSTKEQPIGKHHPVTSTCLPTHSTIKGILLPLLDLNKHSKSNKDFEDWALDTYEWLSLVGIESPRVLQIDSIDPFLCRYQVPNNDDSNTAVNMIKLTWNGLVPAQWIRALFIELSVQCQSRKAEEAGEAQNLFAMSAYSFKTEVIDQREGYTILCLPDDPTDGLQDPNAASSSARGNRQRQGWRFILWEIFATHNGNSPYVSTTYNSTEPSILAPSTANLSKNTKQALPMIYQRDGTLRPRDRFFAEDISDMDRVWEASFAACYKRIKASPPTVNPTGPPTFIQAENHSGSRAGNQAGNTTENMTGSRAGHSTGYQTGNHTGHPTGSQARLPIGTQIGNQKVGQAGPPTGSQAGNRAGLLPLETQTNQRGYHSGNQPRNQTGNRARPPPGTQATSPIRPQAGPPTGNRAGNWTENQNGVQAENPFGPLPVYQAGNQTSGLAGNLLGDRTGLPTAHQKWPTTGPPTGVQTGGRAGSQAGIQYFQEAEANVRREQNPFVWK